MYYIHYCKEHNYWYLDIENENSVCPICLKEIEILFKER